MTAEQLFDAGLRGFAAVVWWIAAIRIVRGRERLNGDAFRRMLGSIAIAILLTVLTIGPSIVPVVGSALVRNAYTATASMMAIIGLAFAMVRPR